MNKAELARMIQAGAGQRKADLVIKNVRLLDIITGEITTSDIAIVGNRIVGTHSTYEGEREIDGADRFAVPGFIDTHLHIESSLVSPMEFDHCVLPYGLTTAICDPHEIANVLGAAGIKYFLDASERSLMDIKVNLSSCVPATAFETSGAELLIEDLLPYRDHPSVIGLAEFMNFPGVINTNDEVLDKLLAFQDGHIDGHAPLLRGDDLNGYLAAKIRTDHECTTADEAREKMRKGMAILIREGSVSKDLNALAEVLTAESSSFVALCTDDRNPLDIHEEGHLDSLIRRLIAKGCPMHHVYRAASHSAARIFGLDDRGIVAPGWLADIVLLDDLEQCAVSDVIKSGQLVDDAAFAARPSLEPIGLHSMKAQKTTPDQFKVPASEGKNLTPMMGVKPGLILTYREEGVLPREDGILQPDTAQDAIQVSVVERHGKNGNIGHGFVKGFGLKQGAIASSVGHDSHNITLVGTNPDDLSAAANRIIDMRGGFCVAHEGKILAELSLPIAGLMSELPFEEVAHALEKLRDAAHGLGCTLPEPFLQVAFLALPVIPHLKMTDYGLFDVDAFDFVK
ncbi:adenine deaminase [Maritalea myrionectae]|uniref:adenine deaminase n=1 Tax=Maritalea myrionectae TaxID=454601 RepID=UPI00041A6041